MTAITTAQIYVTTDGKKFDSENDAVTHQSDLDNGAAVDAHLDQFFPVDPAKTKQGPTRSIARRAILGWIGAKA